MNDLRFHHLGIAVKDLEKSIAQIRALGYQISDNVYDPAQDASLIFCKHSSMPSLELIYNPDRFKSILKGQDFVIYHICFETHNINKALSNFERKVTIKKPCPAKLFNNREVSFFKIDGLGIVELLEE